MGAGKQPRASQVMNEVAVATPTPREVQEGDSQQKLLERLKHMPARHPAGREALHFPVTLLLVPSTGRPKGKMTKCAEVRSVGCHIVCMGQSMGLKCEVENAYHAHSLQILPL